MMMVMVMVVMMVMMMMMMIVMVMMMMMYWRLTAEIQRPRLTFLPPLNLNKELLSFSAKLL